MFTISRRTDLGNILKGLLGSDYVYFQPSAQITLSYPCIVYNWTLTDEKFADDQPYLTKRGYTITVIDKDPDSLIPEKVSKLPLCSFKTRYPKDNLNHTIYNLYY